MDYTIRPERNGVPGDYNLNLLQELYGTPDRPRGSTETTVATDIADTSNSDSGWDLIPDFHDNDKKDEKEKDKDKEDEEEDEDEKDRRLLRRRLDDDFDAADVEEFERKCSMECTKEYCVYKYNHRYLVKINQFLAPPRP